MIHEQKCELSKTGNGELFLLVKGPKISFPSLPPSHLPFLSERGARVHFRAAARKRESWERRRKLHRRRRHASEPGLKCSPTPSSVKLIRVNVKRIFTHSYGQLLLVYWVKESSRPVVNFSSSCLFLVQPTCFCRLLTSPPVKGAREETPTNE